ncbi:hypothetical protein N2152v2_006610 [Parachlorella kessleri]
MQSLCNSLSSMHLRSRPVPSLTFKSAVGGKQLLAKQRMSVVPAATPFTVEAKQNSLKRQRTAEKARLQNKSRKSEVSTRMKKVFKALDGLKTAGISSEQELAPADSLLAEVSGQGRAAYSTIDKALSGLAVLQSTTAYSVIDKAVGKGVLHINTGARRKARLAKARKNLLIAAGLYSPPQQQ